MSEIYQALRRCWGEKSRAVVATIIDAVGSVYRREGARCIIFEDGSITGIISGGCIESDLYEYAKEVLSSGIPRTFEYDFRGDEDLIWGLGVGCNGALKVLLEPFDAINYPSMTKGLLDDFELRFQSRSEYCVATVIKSDNLHRFPVGYKINFSLHKLQTQDDIDSSVTVTVTDTVRDAFRNSALNDSGLLTVRIDEVNVQMFVEEIVPRRRVTIFGAGPDARPVIKLLNSLGWHVTVVDHRSDLAHSTRLPGADAIKVIKRPEYQNLAIDEGDFVVVMTHNYQIDQQILRLLLPRDIPYLGILGPKNRTERLLDDAAKGMASQEGPAGQKFQLSEENYEKIHSPIGLDIGAESPEEIALSIVAEMIARKTGSQGGSLRDKTGPIHKVWT